MNPKLRIILVISAFVMAIALPAYWYIDYRNSVERAARETEQRLTTRVTELTQYAESWLDKRVSLLRQKAASEDVQSMASWRQTPILQILAREHHYISEVMIVDLEGKAIARSDELPLKTYADRKWFSDTIKGDLYGSDVTVSRVKGIPSWALAVPIVSSDKKVHGVLVMKIDLSKFSDSVPNLKFEKTGYSFILNDKNQVIVHSNKAFTGVLADFNSHPAVMALGNKERQKVVFQDGFSFKKVMAIAQKTKHGWTVVAQQDHEEAYAEVHNSMIGSFENLFSKK